MSVILSSVSQSYDPVLKNGASGGCMVFLRERRAGNGVGYYAFR
jgi:hypothetical protein